MNTGLHSTRHHRDATWAIPRLELLVRFADKEDLTVGQNQFAGTLGEFRPLEGFQLKFVPPKPNLRIRYMAHLARLGDTEWVGDGQFVGGHDKSHIVEGFAVELAGSAARADSVSYMAHLAYVGDSEFFRDGQFCGTREQERRVEGMLVRVNRRRGIDI